MTKPVSLSGSPGFAHRIYASLPQIVKTTIDVARGVFSKYQYGSFVVSETDKTRHRKVMEMLKSSIADNLSSREKSKIATFFMKQMRQPGKEEFRKFRRGETGLARSVLKHGQDYYLLFNRKATDDPGGVDLLLGSGGSKKAKEALRLNKGDEVLGEEVVYLTSALNDDNEAAFNNELAVIARLEDLKIPHVEIYATVSCSPKKKANKPDKAIMLMRRYTPFENLRKLERRLSPEEKRNLANQLLTQIALWHENGLGHGDLKGANVYLDRERGTAVFADYGTAFGIRKNDETAGAAGTPHWMPPERFNQGTLYRKDFASDIWGLGLVLFQLLDSAHQLPKCVADTADPTLVGKHLSKFTQKDIDMQIDVRFGHDKRICALLKSMLTIDPEKRITAEGLKNLHL